MECPRCGRWSEGLACAYCTEEKSRLAIWDLQLTYLDSWRRNETSFAVVRVRVNAPWHLRLFGDLEHTWCGEKITAGPRNRDRLLYKEVTNSTLRNPVCAECVGKLRELEEREAIRQS